MERFENGVYDLRSALEFLRGRPGQLAETAVEVDPEAELSGVYRRVGREERSCAQRGPTVRRCCFGI